MNEHELVLEVNEITVLMAVNAVGIIALIGMFVYLAVDGILGKN